VNKDIRVISFRTADIVGPEFTLGTPGAVLVQTPVSGRRTATISVALNEPGDATCMIEPCSSSLTLANCASFIAPSVPDILDASTAVSVASESARVSAANQTANVTLTFPEV
jgi:hypothetical protein